MTKLELSKQFRDYPDVLDAYQASELLGVSIKQMYRLLKDQTVPSVRIGRSHRIAKVNLIDFIRGGKRQQCCPKNVSKIVWTCPEPCGMLVFGNTKKSPP